MAAMVEYGLFLPNWQYERGDRQLLKATAQRITAEQFDQRMTGHIFCPSCFTNLTRRPLVGNLCSDNRRAYFAHLPRYRAVECNQRTPESQGYNFEVEEIAKRAIERGDLVIVSGFLQELQDARGPALPYAAGPVEDPEGPGANMPIARHNGDDFMVPGRSSTVLSICRRLDENLSKYYVLPGMQVPRLLRDTLRNSSSVTGNDPTPRMYFGKIKHVHDHRYQTTVWLEHHPSLKDFALTGSLPDMHEKGIRAGIQQRYVIFWGPVVDHGYSHGVRGVAWGEYALVPAIYTGLLDQLSKR